MFLNRLLYSCPKVGWALCRHNIWAEKLQACFSCGANRWQIGRDKQGRTEAPVGRCAYSLLAHVHDFYFQFCNRSLLRGSATEMDLKEGFEQTQGNGLVDTLRECVPLILTRGKNRVNKMLWI